MYRETQEVTDTTDTPYNDGQDENDLLINNLIYEMPKSLSLATGRVYVNQYPQRQTYNVDRSETLVFNWNTGNSFIDCDNSFLKFKMRAVAPNAVAGPTFGVYGSALNIFKEVRIKSRSGVELSRTENSNLYNNFRLQWTKTDNWINTVGTAFYLNSTTSCFNAANTLITEVCIPLSELSSFFRPLKKGQLLPPQLASNMQIELNCESLATAFKDAAGYFGAASSVQLTDISMLLDTVNMSDDTSKILNLESSQSGLEYTYSRIFSYNSVFPAGSNNINVQIQKACSQSTHAVTIIRNATNTTLSTVDSLISEPWKTKAWQYRLGSSYYPHQTLIDTQTSAINGCQSYMLALSAYDKLKAPFQEASVTLNEFSNSLGVAAVSLERNQSLAVSGLPVNNSRVLEVIIERDGSGDSTNKVMVDCFLSYICVAKAYIDNVSVAV